MDIIIVLSGETQEYLQNLYQIVGKPAKIQNE